MLEMDVLLFEAEVLSTFTVLLLTLFDTPIPRLIVVPGVPELFNGDNVDIVGEDATLT